MGALYRLQQFWQNINAVPLTPEAYATVSATLTPTELNLFSRYTNSDQWHAYRVMRTLRSAGYHEPDLLTAALLHDIGKSCVSLTVIDRSIAVLAAKLFPQKASQWGQGDGQGWQRPFTVRALHPQWGADMAFEADCNTRIVTLIRRHQEPLPQAGSGDTVEDKLLRLLQWADNQN